MRNIQDYVMFGKIISAALLIAGYVILGVVVSHRLVERGWPEWVNMAGPALMAVFGLSQGWFLLRGFLRRR